MLSTTALIWTIIAAAVCWFFAVNQIYALWKTWADHPGTRTWSMVPGRIAISRVGVSPTHPSGRDPAHAGAIIRYRYRVGEKDYEGDSIRIGGKSRSMGLLAKALIKKFPDGRPVEVYYDPKDPSKSSLDMKGKGPHGSIIILIVFGAIAGILTAHAIAGKMIMMENGLPAFALGMPIAMILICFGCVALTISELRRAKASTAWPTTKGKVVDSKVVEHEETRTDDDGDESTSTVYRPHIRYSYRADGADYTADTWKGRLRVSSGSPKYAERVVARYPAGQTVTVHYDPTDPGMGILEPGNHDGAGVALTVGIIFGLAGALIFWAMTAAEWVQAV
jgi:Protein of unknown function (DUF3592)